MGSLGTGSGSEVSEGFSSLSTSQKDGVLTSGGLNSKLVEGHSLTTICDDSFSGLFSESQSADGELGAFKESSIIGDGSNNNSSLAFLSSKVLYNSRDGDGVSVGVGLMESL